MNPQVQQAINNINAYIVENHNNEITGNVLNPILIELANLFDIVGDLSDLNTADSDSIVSAINWVLNQISTGITIHSGQANPNDTPPASFAVGDLYSRVDMLENPYQIYIYNGYEWAEIRQVINDSITGLDTTWSSEKISEAIQGDRFENMPTIDLVGNEITISNASWWIQGVNYNLSPDFEDTINYTSVAGMMRKDIIVAVAGNSMLRIQGAESDTNPLEPTVPPNTLLVTSIDVFHDSIGVPTEPIVGNNYVKKMGYQYINKTSGSPGTLAYTLAEDKRNYVILNWNAPETIAGFTLSSMFGGDTIYNGMIVTIDNQSAHTPILLDQTNEDALADVTFDFRAGISQYIMKPGEFLTFKLRNSVLVFVSTNQAETDVEVPTKTSDLINDGADDTSTYVEHDELAKVATSGNYLDLDNLPNPNDFVKTTVVGVANGVAPTGSDNKIPLGFFPDAILGQVVFGGTVVPATGVATLSTNAKTKLGTTDATITLTNDTTPITGYEANGGIYYIAFDDGTFGGINLTVGDWLISTGSGWSKIDNTDAVTMVNGKTGAVTLNAGDIGYSNTESGLDAENEQDAIDEIEEKKLDKVTTGSTERVYSVNEANNQAMIPTMEQFVSDTDIINALEAITTDIATISVSGKTMYKGQLYVSDSPAYIYLAYDDNQIIRK